MTRLGPKGSTIRMATKPRSLLINDARWEKIKCLGAEWLENQTDKAKEPT